MLVNELPLRSEINLHYVVRCPRCPNKFVQLKYESSGWVIHKHRSKFATHAKGGGLYCQEEWMPPPPKSPVFKYYRPDLNAADPWDPVIRAQLATMTKIGGRPLGSPVGSSPTATLCPTCGGPRISEGVFEHIVHCPYDIKEAR